MPGSIHLVQSSSHSNDNDHLWHLMVGHVADIDSKQPTGLVKLILVVNG